MGVEIQLNALVTDVDYSGLTVKVKDADGDQPAIESAVKVCRPACRPARWASMLADQSDGTEVDQAGRVVVEPDLTVKGHPNVFVIGDLMSVPGVPGMAQGAIQGAAYAAKQIKTSSRQKATRRTANRSSTSTRAAWPRLPVQRGRQVGKLEFGGFLAWLAWLGLHLYYLVGNRSRSITAILVVRHLPRPRPQPAGDHRKVGLRAQSVGGNPGSERPKIRWVTRAKIDPS